MDEKEKRAVHEVNHEWTAADVLQMGCDRADPAYAIAEAHNAALARQAGQANIRTNEMLTNVRRERDEAQKQLAAGKEEVLKVMAENTELCEELDQAVKLLKLEDIDAAIARLEKK